MKLDLELFGTQQLNEMFAELTTPEQKKAIQNGLVKSANIIRLEMVSNYRQRKLSRVNKGTDRILKYINKVYKGKKDLLSVRVGTWQYLARWTSGGTAERQTLSKKRTGHSTGSIKAQNYLRDAITSKQEEARKEVVNNIQKAMEKIIQKKKKIGN